jgi:hypothetical protein
VLAGNGVVPIHARPSLYGLGSIGTRDLLGCGRQFGGGRRCVDLPAGNAVLTSAAISKTEETVIADVEARAIVPRRGTATKSPLRLGGIEVRSPAGRVFLALQDGENGGSDALVNWRRRVNAFQFSATATPRLKLVFGQNYIAEGFARLLSAVADHARDGFPALLALALSLTDHGADRQVNVGVSHRHIAKRLARRSHRTRRTATRQRRRTGRRAT